MNKKVQFYNGETHDNFRGFISSVKNKYGDKVLFRTKTRRKETEITYNQFYSDVCRMAHYFSTTYGTGKTIALIGENSYEWILSYFAVSCSGNIIVPLDKELSAEDISKLLIDCGSQMLITSKEYFDVAEEIKELLPDTEIVVMSAFADIIATESADELPNVDANAPTAIVYTSGTTGKSKGVVLTQKNLCADVYSCCRSCALWGKSMAFLPLHHTFSFMVNVMASSLYGVEVLICASLKNILADINAFHPNYLIVVPMIIEKMDKSISDNIQKQGKTKTVRIASKIGNALATIGIDVKRKLFSDIHAGLGGNLEFVISGGAPINQELIDRFNAYGIAVYNGYGITECSPVVSVNSQKFARSGSVGKALKDVHVMIDSPNEKGEGEICVKGDIVMSGYYNMPEETAQVMTDRWFHTGDLGKIDKDGYIYITGRIKNLIILSNGKNVSPEELELLLGEIPGVAEVMVCGSGDKLVAEIYPDEDFKANNSDLQSYFNEQIDKLNTTLPPYKAIAEVVLRDTEFEKTTTKKIKRNYK